MKNTNKSAFGAQRFPYLIAALVILGLEIYIGGWVRDAFIRPYGGDILVAALLCCLWRCVSPKGNPFGIFLFCVAVELSQLLNLPTLLGIEGTVLAIILGSSFAWLDILCYAAGCAAFYGIEYFFLRRKNPSIE